MIGLSSHHAAQRPCAMSSPVIEVAVAVVQDDRGHVLLAERTARQVAAGFWELPGGKIDSGESASAAAVRELDEETGIHATAFRPWLCYVHAFPTKRVRLHIFRVERWRGTPVGREGQRLAWVDPAEPGVAPLLPSNARAMFALGLPQLLAVVDHEDPARAAAAAIAACDRGAGLIVIRAPRCAPDQRIALARRIIAAVAPAGPRVLLQGSALEAQRAGAHGAFACSATLRRSPARPSVRLWGVACDDASDRALAAQRGADFAIEAPPLLLAANNRQAGLTMLRADGTAAELPLFKPAATAARDTSRFPATTGVLT
ncbi:NUDIX domain-containing protein [Bradyrhizobium sp.]|jgi:8-oxo-dGTP diphosphatase|uniref:NUDIX domain-containing protein n=2 Tax=Nitrobacteraceae TaxID=41294 RepID=UPI00039F2F58|nr:MAG: NUDIX domain-containing protein [Bradyrhizobiaceae bacterium]